MLLYTKDYEKSYMITVNRSKMPTFILDAAKEANPTT